MWKFIYSSQAASLEYATSRTLWFRNHVQYHVRNLPQYFWSSISNRVKIQTLNFSTVREITRKKALWTDWVGRARSLASPLEPYQVHGVRLSGAGPTYSSRILIALSNILFFFHNSYQKFQYKVIKISCCVKSRTWLLKGALDSKLAQRCWRLNIILIRRSWSKNNNNR